VSAVRTIEVTHFGGPEVLELGERPDPVAGPGQVVVDVAGLRALWTLWSVEVRVLSGALEKRPA
jgi:hypothetical protein